MTINLAGRAGSWVLCPKGEEHELWCLANIGERMLQQWYKPAKIFQLHDEKLVEPYLTRYADRAVLIRPSTKLPDAQLLPAKELVEKFGRRMSSSMAWMMAWAIMMKPDCIGVYGVDMRDSFEYGKQRDMMFYMIGRAEAEGIKVIIPNTSGIHYPDATYELRKGES